MAVKTGDSWLGQWIAMQARAEKGIPITLFANGMLISGTPISVSVYFRGMGEQLGDVAESAGIDGGTIRQSFADFADGLESNEKKRVERQEALVETLPAQYDRTSEQEESLAALQPYYVHLRDVTVIMPATNSFQFTYWRGRISEIVGYTIGTASTSGSAPGDVKM